MHAVFQDGFERICATLIFRNAFPDLFATMEMIKDSPVIVANFINHATDIYNWLISNAYYMNNMSCLVSILK